MWGAPCRRPWPWAAQPPPPARGREGGAPSPTAAYLPSRGHTLSPPARGDCVLSHPGAHSWLPRPPDRLPLVLLLQPAWGCRAASAGFALALLGLRSHHEANKTLKRLLGPDCLSWAPRPSLRAVCLPPSLLCVVWLDLAPHVTVLADTSGSLKDGDPSVSSGWKGSVASPGSFPVGRVAAAGPGGGGGEGGACGR